MARSGSKAATTAAGAGSTKSGTAAKAAPATKTTAQGSSVKKTGAKKTSAASSSSVKPRSTATPAAAATAATAATAKRAGKASAKATGPGAKKPVAKSAKSPAKSPAKTTTKTAAKSPAKGSAKTTAKTTAKSSPARKTSAASKSAGSVSGSAAKSGGRSSRPGRGSVSLAVKDDETPWTKEEIAEVRGELSTDRDRLRSELNLAEEELADLMRDAGDGAGNDQADVGSTTFERDHEMTLANNARLMLEQTERALGRLDDGSYGVCESCGQPIGKNRLMAFPRATLCLSCKQREERR